MKLDGLRRVDVPEIDRDAFREAIINAFCHRNYHEYDSVNIAVFKDRVEVRNPGGLFGGLTIEQITKENVSKRRNELIAEIFHRVHYVEKWGRGIELILSKEPKAAFKVIADMFVSTFRRKDYSGETVEKTTQKATQKTTQKIIALIREKPQITRRELALEIGLTEDGIKYHLKKMQERNTIKRVGPDKGGHWQIIESEDEK